MPELEYLLMQVCKIVFSTSCSIAGLALFIMNGMSTEAYLFFESVAVFS